MGHVVLGCRTGAVEGYGRATYGDAFADVYDDWYAGITDAEQTADVVAALAAPGRRVLELAVGTGRLAVPLAARGSTVTGVDASAAMLERLRARDVGATVAVTLGDMVDDLPAGPFDVALIAYNSLFNLESAERAAGLLRRRRRVPRARRALRRRGVRARRSRRPRRRACAR